jgi:hypothetical protein
MIGHLDDAKRLGNRAFEYSTHYPGVAAYALHLLGDIAAHPDRLDADSGEALYRQALTLAERRGMRPLIGHCHFSLGRLDRRTGKQGRAQEHLGIATALYREMDMTYWLDLAATEMGQLL